MQKRFHIELFLAITTLLGALFFRDVVTVTAFGLSCIVLSVFRVFEYSRETDLKVMAEEVKKLKERLEALSLSRRL